MTLEELFKDVKDKYEPENEAEGYEELPTLTDRVMTYGEPYDLRIGDR